MRGGLAPVFSNFACFVIPMDVCMGFDFTYGDVMVGMFYSLCKL